jgi:hypothetical protein
MLPRSVLLRGTKIRIQFQDTLRYMYIQFKHDGKKLRFPKKNLNPDDDDQNLICIRAKELSGQGICYVLSATSFALAREIVTCIQKAFNYVFTQVRPDHTAIRN